MSSQLSDREIPAGVLVSGGINSFCLLHRLAESGRRAIPVFIQSGFRWEEAELFWLKKFLRATRFANFEPLEILQLPMRDSFGMHWSVTGVKVPSIDSKASDTVIPGRDLLMVIKAAVYLSQRRANEIFVGCSRERSMTALLSDEPRRGLEKIIALSLCEAIEVKAPFLTEKKEDVFYVAKEHGFDLTFSCLNPKGYHHCGECHKCYERKTLFARTGITDKTQYHIKGHLV